MKKFSMLVTLAVALVFSLTQLTAQEGRKPQGDRLEKRMEVLSKELSHSPGQFAQVKAIEQKYMETKHEKKEAHHAMSAETKAKLAQVLTPEQMQKMEALKADRPTRGGAAGKDMKKGTGKGKPDQAMSQRGSDDRFERLSQELKLTEAQKPKVQEILKSAKEQHQDMRQDNKGEWMKQREAKQAELAKVLSPDQMTRYKALASEKVEQHKGKKAGGKKAAPQEQPVDMKKRGQ